MIGFQKLLEVARMKTTIVIAFTLLTFSTAFANQVAGKHVSSPVSNPIDHLPQSWTASRCIELGCHFSCELEADGKTCKPQGVFKCDCGGGSVKIGGCTGY